ncbi:MAG: hypothetical protein GX306_05670 [Clostridiales bacterium]|jgi:DNA repair exonuclease SbcCD ATPase subunit|nr:hypothetical protein [Clostridiales bacterium]
MEGNNLLTGGVETLNVMKDHLLDLQGTQAQYNTLLQGEKQLAKKVEDLEKDLSEEIQRTTKKRRQEIEETFDDQISKTKAKIKKTKDKRDKYKNSKVSERISEETAFLREENKKLKQEAKAIFRSKHIPSICNSKIFYALYLPKAFTDFLILLVTLVIILLAIPCGIYFLVLPEEKIPYLIIIFIITAAIFFTLYVLIGNHTKDKHLEEFRQVNGIRKNIRANKKKIAVIKRNIKKDRDESSYGLENFDEELHKLEKEAADILEQKKEALEVFDSTTSHVISNDIRGHYEEKLNSLKAEYNKVSSDRLEAEEKIKALTLKLANEYEPFIGKDLMTLDHLDSLINTIHAGLASTISEAVVYYRKSLEESGLK